MLSHHARKKGCGMKIASWSPGSAVSGEACELAAVRPPKGASNGFWQHFTAASFAGKRRAHTRHGFWHAVRIGGGYHDRLYLCRITRRLRLQPGSRPGRRGAQENAWPQGGRGRKSPGNRRCRKDHRVDDQSRRRNAAVSDLVRILQSAHDQDGEQVSKASLRALRRIGG